MGAPARVDYPTEWEIKFIRDLAAKEDKSKFKAYAKLVMEGWRTYDHRGMGVDSRRVRAVIEEEQKRIDMAKVPVPKLHQPISHPDILQNGEEPNV